MYSNCFIQLFSIFLSNKRNSTMIKYYSKDKAKKFVRTRERKKKEYRVNIYYFLLFFFSPSFFSFSSDSLLLASKLAYIRLCLWLFLSISHFVSFFFSFSLFFFFFLFSIHTRANSSIAIFPNYCNERK